MSQKRLAWATLTGPDAKDFLHRVTTVNVQNLEIGQGAKGCILNAQGKIQTIFTLWQSGPQEFGFEYDPGKDDHWKKNFLAAIDQYTFAEKMTLTDVSDLECQWFFGDPATIGAGGLQPGHTLVNENGARICHQGSIDFGRPWYTIWGKTSGSTEEEATLELWRIQATRPRVDFEIVDGSSPLELGLVDAIASNKGCYPGQEVIEKVISLGSPAKRLARIEGAGTPPAIGTAILADSAEVGRVTSVARAGQGFVALGVVRKTHAKENIELQIQATTGSRITHIAPYA